MCVVKHRLKKSLSAFDNKLGSGFGNAFLQSACKVFIGFVSSSVKFKSFLHLSFKFCAVALEYPTNKTSSFG